MNFKKLFDYSDIYCFLPDNFTMGTARYYREKFHDALPDDVCDMMELRTRVEYNDEDLKEYMDKLVIRKNDEYDRLMLEFQERENEGKTDNDNEMDNETINKISNINISDNTNESQEHDNIPNCN